MAARVRWRWGSRISRVDSTRDVLLKLDWLNVLAAGLAVYVNPHGPPAQQSGLAASRAEYRQI
jgi:hypothetical protein